MASEPQASRVSLSAIGEKLRMGREKKGLSIEQAQKQTHIHSTVLRALEEGRCDDILTPTYVKSFLKKYSVFLGLNSKDFLNDYTSLHPEMKQNAVPKLDAAVIENDFDSSALIYFMSRFVLFLLASALVIFLGVKIFTAVKKHSRAQVNARVRLAVPAKTKIRTAGPLKPHSTSQRPQPAAASEERTALKSTSVDNKTPLKLMIRVKQPVLVQLKKDGIVYFKRVLPKGAVESVTAANSINIYVAKAEAIELVLNGKAITSPGKGVIKNLEITKSGVRIR